MALGTPTDLGGANCAITATTATVTLTTTVAAAIGDLVVVAVGSSTTGRVLNTVTDNAGGNTYAIDATSNDGVNPENLWVASCRVATTMPIGTVITATFASSLSSARGISAFKVSGTAAVTPVDVTAVATGTVAFWSATAAGATAQADEVLVSCSWLASAQVNTPSTVKAGGSTYTELSDTNGGSRSITTEALVVSAIDTYRAAGTWGGAARWRAAFVSYKAAAGSVTNNVTLTATQGQTATMPKTAGMTYSSTQPQTITMPKQPGKLLVP